MKKLIERLGTDISYAFAYFLLVPLPLWFASPFDPEPPGFYPFGLTAPYVLAQLSAAVPAAI